VVAIVTVYDGDSLVDGWRVAAANVVVQRDKGRLFDG